MVNLHPIINIPMSRLLKSFQERLCQEYFLKGEELRNEKLVKEFILN